MDSELRSGDLLFCGIGGFVPGFVPVGVGQLALFVTRRWWRVVETLEKVWEQSRTGETVQDTTSTVSVNGVNSISLS